MSVAVPMRNGARTNVQKQIIIFFSVMRKPIVFHKYDFAILGRQYKDADRPRQPLGPPQTVWLSR